MPSSEVATPAADSGVRSVPVSVITEGRPFTAMLPVSALPWVESVATRLPSAVSSCQVPSRGAAERAVDQMQNRRVTRRMASPWEPT